MSYHLYRTEGFVLGREALREGDLLLALFTREFGLIHALAKSAREERSKLRYGLQDFSCGTFSLVRGREFWRVTGAASSYNLCGSFRREPETAAMFSRVFKLLKRLLPDEGPADSLFDTLSAAARFLMNNSDTRAALADAEVVLALRILYLLGYLAPRREWRLCLSDSTLWSGKVLSAAASFRTLAIADINRSLRESQL